MTYRQMLRDLQKLTEEQLDAEVLGIFFFEEVRPPKPVWGRVQSIAPPPNDTLGDEVWTASQPPPRGYDFGKIPVCMGHVLPTDVPTVPSN
jgi:hypothetical protein